MATHAKGKHSKSTHKSDDAKAPVIANVFDDDQKQESTPAPRQRVVVEVEEPAAPSAPADLPSPPSVLPPPTEVRVEPSAETTPAPAPVEPSTSASTPAPQPAAPSAPVEPPLPAFFAQDLNGGSQPGQSSQTAQQAVIPPPAVTVDASTPIPPITPSEQPVSPVEAAVPQAFVGEIHEVSEGGGSKKKIIGIVLIVFALLLLAGGLFLLFGRGLLTPTESEPVSVAPVTQSSPTPTASPLATGSAQLTATASGELTELKKKFSVSVLNGTSISGLAGKQADILRKAGYTMGSIGNGAARNAGTIVAPKEAAPLVADIQKLLSDFTFTATESATAKNITVTLGEPN